MPGNHRPADGLERHRHARAGPPGLREWPSARRRTRHHRDQSHRRAIALSVSANQAIVDTSAAVNLHPTECSRTYHVDAVLEFPQTGERFVGRDTFTQWRSQHPVSFDDIRFRVVRVTARDDFAAVELFGSHDRGATWGHGVSLLDFTGDKISHERLHRRELAGAGVAREVALRLASRASFLGDIRV